MNEVETHSRNRYRHASYGTWLLLLLTCPMNVDAQLRHAGFLPEPAHADGRDGAHEAPLAAAGVGFGAGKDEALARMDIWSRRGAGAFIAGGTRAFDGGVMLRLRDAHTQIESPGLQAQVGMSMGGRDRLQWEIPMSMGLLWQGPAPSVVIHGWVAGGAVIVAPGTDNQAVRSTVNAGLRFYSLSKSIEGWGAQFSVSGRRHSRPSADIALVRVLKK